MNNGSEPRGCKTCYYWNAQGGSDFRERCAYRFQLPYCERDHLPRTAESGRSCWGWKLRQA